MIRKILTAGSVIALFLLLLYAIAVARNNLDAAQPRYAELEERLDRAIGWLADRQIKSRDPLLWWMLYQAARINQDPRLVELTDNFRAIVEQERERSFLPWLELFDVERTMPVPAQALAGLVDYNQHIIYASTCDTLIGLTPLVQAQMDANYCRRERLFAPACPTHQLLGVQIMLENGCDSDGRTNALRATLIDDVERLLTWDPRVVDVYLQRALMLAYTGSSGRLKPVWIRKILAAQLPRGAWSDFAPLFPLGGSYFFGFHRMALGPGKLRGRFHTTAQGVLLLTLLLQEMDSREQIRLRSSAAGDPGED